VIYCLLSRLNLTLEMSEVQMCYCWIGQIYMISERAKLFFLKIIFSLYNCKCVFFPFSSVQGPMSFLRNVYRITLCFIWFV
jgi:hypothetical protein